MDDHIVTDRHVITDFGDRFLVQGVNDAIVLNIDAITDGDCVHVAAQDGVEPNAAIVTHGNIAHNDCAVSEEAVLSDFGVKSPYFFYDSHMFC